MKSYGKIEKGFWRNPKIRAMDEDARWLLNYLYTSPHSNSVGCYVLPSPYIQSDLQWTEDRVSRALSIVLSKGRAKYDHDTELVYLPGWFEHRPVTNVNHAKGAANIIDELPDCRLKAECIQAFNSHMDSQSIDLSIGLSNYIDVDIDVNEEEYSEPKGSGDEAPDAPSCFDPKVIKWFVENTGTSERNVRSSFGKMVQLAGGDQAAVLSVLREAATARPPPVEPIAWCMKQFQGGKSLEDRILGENADFDPLTEQKNVVRLEPNGNGA